MSVGKLLNSHSFNLSSIQSILFTPLMSLLLTKRKYSYENFNFGSNDFRWIRKKWKLFNNLSAGRTLKDVHWKFLWTLSNGENKSTSGKIIIFVLCLTISVVQLMHVVHVIKCSTPHEINCTLMHKSHV